MSTEVVVVTKPNTTIKNSTLGRVIVRAPGFRAVKVRLIGDGEETTNVGMFDFTHPAAGGVLEDCAIRPAEPSIWLTGVLGHDFQASGLTIQRTVDGFGVYNTHSPDANVLIQKSLVDDLFYGLNDPNHADRHTHNDAVQIQGGTNIIVRDNTLHAFLMNEGPWGRTATGQAIAITPNVSKVKASLLRNHLNGGAQPLTAIPAKHGAIIAVRDNTFGKSSHTKRAAAFDSHVRYSWSGNVWANDDPAKPTITRDL